MPTYDYKCSGCGHVFEVFHEMNDEPEVQCPRCRTAAVRLISGGAGTIFKGSGFYATDRRSSNRGSCGSGSPCCGREEPCDHPPCAD